jgi:hypothetical protein
MALDMRPPCDPDQAERLLMKGYVSLPRLTKPGSAFRVAVLARRGPYEIRLTERDKGEGEPHFAIGIFHSDNEDCLDGRSFAAIEDGIDLACEFLDEAGRRSRWLMTDRFGSASGVAAGSAFPQSSVCMRAKKH